MVPFVIAGSSDGIASERARQCGGESNVVQGEFDLSSARDFWEAFPAAGMAPEIARNQAPVHVVVFSGEFSVSHIMMVGNPAGTAVKLSDVVCLIHQDGHIDLYSDVSRSGSQFGP